jgi:hypothetical protein
MEFKYAYEKLMDEHKLKFEDLPDDAKIGIKTIENIAKAVNMAEKKGKKVSPEVTAKIKANDKWIVNEILDFIGDKDENEDEMPFDKADFEKDFADVANDSDDSDDSDDDDDNDDDNQEIAVEVEKELTEMFNSGKVQWQSEEIKGKFPTVYRVLFNGYDAEEENGIRTTNYSLLETKREIFEISKTKKNN